MAQLLGNDTSALTATVPHASSVTPQAGSWPLASTPWWAFALLGGVASLLAIALVFTLIDSYCRCSHAVK